MTHNKMTTKEIFRSISESMAGINNRRIGGSYKNQREIALLAKDKRIPFVILDLYSTVLRASTIKGFDMQQVHDVWRTASLAYSVGLITLIFDKPLRNLYLQKPYFQLPSFGNIGFESSQSLPMDILHGPGSVALRTLAHMKHQNERQVCAPIIDTGEDYSSASLASLWADLWADSWADSWADFTYALLDHLVKDELVTGALRCKLLARDLGL